MSRSADSVFTMNSLLRTLTLAAGCMAAGPAAFAADAGTPAAAPEAKKGLRVLAAPEAERRIWVQRADQGEPVEKETVAFLGVETAPVSATVAAQLGLARGTGLVVNHIVPKSAAAGALAVHDILLKLDDQILIETRQLSVLIRNKKEGDEIALTYLRGGKQATATVKLGKQEVPKLAAAAVSGGRVFAFAPDAAGGGFGEAVPSAEYPPGAAGDVLGLIERIRPGVARDTLIERRSGPGFRAISIHPGNSTLTFSDDAGSLELTIRDGAKTLVAKDRSGAQRFSGPVTTPEDRAALPVDVRARLEKVEGLHDVTFRTDGDFQGAETKIIRPRGIGMPLPPAPPPAPAPGAPVRLRLPAPYFL